MGLSAGTAFIDVQPKLGAGFAAGLGGKLTGVLGGVGSKAGLALAGGIVAGGAIAGTALAGVGAAGVAAFSDLERGIQEVGTLLPDLDAGGLANLRDQVQNFSKEVGLTTSETVPALYQAISAGVPQDNVFEFLELANQAAIAGVTDIETAVDGLTTVTNAYGSDVISAGEASDLLFTAVKGGKTTFDELSGALFNVVPVAAGLGVPLSEVTASLQAITAQGTPTNVAATQIRAALVELGKEGSKVSDVFKEATGQSFPDFVAAGGTIEQALSILGDEADKSGVRLTDLFGSVEAGNAVLQLTSTNGAGLFSDALADMADSAGATEAAFGTMDQGIGRSWDKIKASFQVALTEIGERLAPFVETVLEFIADKLPGAIDFLIGVFETLGSVLGPIFDFLGGLFGGFKSNAEDATDGVGSAFGTVGAIIADVGEIIRAILGGLQAFWETWGERIMAVLRIVGEFIVERIGNTLQVIQGVIQTVLGIITGDWSKAWEGIRNVFGGIWDEIVNIFETAWELIQVVLGAGLQAISQLWETTWQTISDFFGAIWEGIQATVELIFEAVRLWIELQLAAIKAIWETVWGAVSAFFGAIWSGIQSTVETIFAAISGFISSTLGTIQTAWETVWGAVSAFFAAIWDTIDGTVRAVFGAISVFIAATLGTIRQLWERAWAAVTSFLSTTWETIKGLVSGAMAAIINFISSAMGAVAQLFKNGIDAVVNFFKELPGRILGAVGDLAKLGGQLASNLVGGILGGLGGLAGGLTSKLKSGIASALSAVKSFFGIGSPSKVFMEGIGVPLSQGIVEGADPTDSLKTTLTAGISAGLDAARHELRTAGPLSTMATLGRPAAAATALGFGGPGPGVEINLAEGAVQVINPEPEPASLTVPRELRRLVTTFGKG